MIERVERVCKGPLVFRYQDATYVPPAKSQNNKICSPTAPTPKIPHSTPSAGRILTPYKYMGRHHSEGLTTYQPHQLLGKQSSGVIAQEQACPYLLISQEDAKTTRKVGGRWVQGGQEGFRKRLSYSSS